MKPKYLLNPKSGAVFPATELLLVKGTGLVACEQDGTPLSTYDARDDDEVIESPFVLNPVTGAVLPWSLLLARQEGLIPCDDQEHANRILKNLGHDELIQGLAEGAEEPSPEADTGTTDTVGLEAVETETKDETEAEEAGTSLEEIADVTVPEAIKDMTKKQIVAHCMENYGEKLDARLNRTMLLEQATMLINSADITEDDIEKISMA